MFVRSSLLVLFAVVAFLGRPSVASASVVPVPVVAVVVCSPPAPAVGPLVARLRRAGFSPVVAGVAAGSPSAAVRAAFGLALFVVGPGSSVCSSARLAVSLGRSVLVSVGARLPSGRAWPFAGRWVPAVRFGLRWWRWVPAR